MTRTSRTLRSSTGGCPRVELSRPSQSTVADPPGAPGRRGGPRPTACCATSASLGTLDRQVRLVDPRLPRQPLRTALVQRLFETWIHTDDIRGVLGGQPTPPDERHVALIVGFGVHLLPAALRLAGADRPPRSARLVLVGPGGGDWIVSPAVQRAPARPPDATVTMEAVEFCYLLGNRRDPDSVPHRVEGDPAVAATLLRAATTLGCD